jgi:phosphoglycolate phosphatase-like HAD superfamily hydrolase
VAKSTLNWRLVGRISREGRDLLKLIEAVIFDMDGVIIDSHSVARGLLCKCANQFGCQLTPEEVSAWGSLSSRQFWQRVKDQFGLVEELSVLISSYDGGAGRGSGTFLSRDLRA